MATRTISNAGGNWNSAATWVEAAVPTSADEVVATATSGNLTVDVAAVCRSIDLTGYVGTFTIPTTFSLSVGDATLPTGSVALKFSTTMTFTCTGGPINFVTTNATQQTVDCGGQFMSTLVFNGVGASWLLTSSTIVNQQDSVTLTNGTLDTNNLNHAWGAFLSSNSNIRTFTMGSSTIVLSCDNFVGGGSATAWTTATTTNLTLTANTATLTFIQDYMNPNMLMVSDTLDFTGASLIFLGAGIATTQFSGTVTVANFTRLGTRHMTDRWQVNNAGFTITNSLTLKGYDAGHRLRVHSNSGGLRTLTLTGATVTCESVDFFAIEMTPAQNLSAIPGGSGDIGSNVGITLTTGDDLYFYAPTPGPKYWSNPALWFLGSGGTGGLSGRIPLPQDNALFDALSIGAYGTNILADQPRLGRDLNFTGVTNSPNVHFNSLSSNTGSFILDTDMTISAVGNINFVMNGNGAGNTFSLGMAGKTWPANGFTISMAGTNTVNLLDDFAANGTFTLTALVNTNNFDITAGGLSQASGTFTMGSSTITLNGTGTVWSSSGTISAGTSLIRLTNTSRLTKTFAGGSKTYNNIELAGTQICNYNFTGSNTFNDFASSNPVSHKILFTAGTTTTVTTFSVNGTAGNRVFIKSITAAGHTLTKSGGGTITVDYAIVERSTGTPVATWSVTNGIDGGNNTDWSGFTSDPFTWTGATDNDFSVGTNWFGGSAPGATDLAFFHTNNIACTLDSAVNVRGIFVLSNYTSTITQANTVDLGELGWFQSGAATFTGATQTINNAGDLIVLAGTYTPTTGITTFDGSIDQLLTLTAAYTNSNVIINKTGNTQLALLSNLTMSTVGQDLTITAGKLNVNGFVLTVNDTLTVDDYLRTTGADLTVGTKVINPTTSTIELFGGATITLDTALGTTFFNLIYVINKIVFTTAGATITVNGTLSSNAFQSLTGVGVVSGQCKIRSTILGQKWFLVLNGPCTVGNTLDIQDCDSTAGNWFKAPQAIYQLSAVCIIHENERCILP